MEELRIRKIDFRFDDDIPFDWNAGNYAWGNAANFAAIIAPAFERYFLRVTREAMTRVDDPALLRNLQQFCAQEGIHSRQHRAHMEVLLRRYPGLRATVDEVEGSYDALYANHDLEFHLSFQAALEGFFGPLAVFLVENREATLGKSDPRIASFILWHVLEEYEHRTSAHALYKALVPSHWPLLRNLPATIAHIAENRRIVLGGFLEHVPEADNPSRGSVATLLDGISWTRRLGFARRLVASLLPGHDPAALPAPAWATQWFHDEAAGKDMTLYFPPITAGE